MKRFILPVVCSLSFAASNAQSYWQQKVDTKIDVILDDRKHILRGFEELTYTNNSPDTLRYIYIHLWPNAYKHDHTQFAEQQYRNKKTSFYYAEKKDRGYIDSLQFSVNGNDVEYFYGESTPDIARIDLPQPLLPGKQITVATPFKVKIPKVFSRLGHTDQSYYITQWFPKPAVYDKKGWHPIPYLDLGEFYSEIGSYEVNITLPANYIVMGTGNIMNEEENEWLDSLASAPLSRDSLYKSTMPKSSERLKTVTFKEHNIHDFAWFADKRWIVRKDTIESPGTGDLITTWSAFFPTHQDQWLKANEHLKNAVKYYGKWIGPYPYKTIKAVQGDLKAGGGMEYPTVTIIDRNAGEPEVIIHEAGHNWFYGILASNERDHAWMDEGLNTFYEQKTTKTLEDKNSKDTSVKKGGNISISMGSDALIYQLAASGKDQAIDQTSINFKEINYGLDIYYKTTLMLQWLEAYMGEEAFERGMHEYYNQWKHKHPYPEDFQKIMQEQTKMPIDWFFEGALKTDKLIDFSIKDVKTTDDGVIVTIKNKSSIKDIPVIIEAYDGDSLIATGTWVPLEDFCKDGEIETLTINLPKEARTWTKIKIAKEIPDGRTQNNEYRRHGLFHRSGLKFAPFAGMNLGSKQKIFVAPAVGYNVYDGFEAGLLFHNLSWPQTKFRYALAPMYGVRSKQFIGTGSVGYNWFPEKMFKEVMIQTDVKSFSYGDLQKTLPEPLFARYLKIAPSINFTFKQPSFTSPVTRTLTLKGYAITEEDYDFNLDTVDSVFIPYIIRQQNNYGLIRYKHKNARTFNPFDYSLEGQLGEYFAKINLEGNLRIDYNTPKKSLYIRAFAGKFFTIKDKFPVTNRYYLNATFTGENDYLYDDTYIGRNEQEGIGARQVSMREGGFKVPTPQLGAPIGRSDNWMLALNLKTDLPLKSLPIRFFLDIGTFSDATKLNPSENRFIYNGGLELHFGDVINIYFPLFMNKDLNDYQKSILQADNFLKRVSFSINLQNINWLKAPSGIIKLGGY